MQTTSRSRIGAGPLIADGAEFSAPFGLALAADGARLGLWAFTSMVRFIVERTGRVECRVVRGTLCTANRFEARIRAFELAERRARDVGLPFTISRTEVW